MIEVPQGSSFTLRIKTAKDLSLFNGYGAIISHEDKTILLRYSKNTLAGYKPTTLGDELLGYFDCKLDSEYTVTAPKGKYYVEALLQKTDGTWESGKITPKSVRTPAFIITESTLNSTPAL